MIFEQLDLDLDNAFIGPVLPCRFAKLARGDRYPRQYDAGRNRRISHIVYEYAYGVIIPAGMQINHRCDVPRCIEPTHLKLGTQRENVAEMHARGRAARPQRKAA